MARYNVEYKGKWACFSSISDGFITEFLDESEYNKWRKSEYGKNNYNSLKNSNIMTIEEAAFSISITRAHEDTLKCMLECGLPKKECEQIIYNMETKNYCPIPKDNGQFECPNCFEKVEKNQTKCTNDTCCINFVWRI